MSISPRKLSLLTGLLAVCFVLAYSVAARAESKYPASEWMKKDTRFKIGVMHEVMAAAKRDGVIMRLSPEYYVKEIDATIENAIRNHDKKGLTTSLGIMIHTIAAMDGDWDNGESKLEHAQKWLGPENFEGFKKMFPQKYERLLQPRGSDYYTWEEVGSSNNLLIHYERASLGYVSSSVVRVWAKTQYVHAEEGVKDLKERGVYERDLKTYDHDLYLYKIDCTANSFAILADYRYRKDGTLIQTFDFPDRWATIPPNSVINGIADRVCGPSGRANEPETGERGLNRFGYVPDQEMAIRIAVAAWIPVYGKELIESEKPYKATLRDGVWHVSGSLPGGEGRVLGGVAEAEINQADGKILRVVHGQ